MANGRSRLGRMAVGLGAGDLPAEFRLAEAQQRLNRFAAEMRRRFGGVAAARPRLASLVARVPRRAFRGSTGRVETGFRSPRFAAGEGARTAIENLAQAQPELPPNMPFVRRTERYFAFEPTPPAVAGSAAGFRRWFSEFSRAVSSASPNIGLDEYERIFRSTQEYLPVGAAQRAKEVYLRMMPPPARRELEAMARIREVEQTAELNRRLLEERGLSGQYFIDELTGAIRRNPMVPPAPLLPYYKARYEAEKAKLQQFSQKIVPGLGMQYLVDVADENSPVPNWQLVDAQRIPRGARFVTESVDRARDFMVMLARAAGIAETEEKPAKGVIEAGGRKYELTPDGRLIDVTEEPISPDEWLRRAEEVQQPKEKKYTLKSGLTFYVQE